ncbi:hypothetical protein SISNIDRAFT_548842 [Sistotremastrum niveocremeum HHB9708]|uniref:F-box domain-containing protein n=1 Tax=Sistotremastrum niveocremeum HHB9708 TaxID=1314777 RepID=A0A164WBL2_9AGAM|nr:hypothetical protein SISNIDRAFT_548842 [Sistotremastrum niveocremeum HHB9708]
MSTSASSKVWAIPELVNLIVWRCPGSMTAKLAQVNKAISEIALASLYRVILGNMHDLLAILAPMEAHSDESGLTFVRPLEQSDWTRFLKYSAHVKEIFLMEILPQRQAISPEAFCVMDATRPTDAIFPFLTSFTTFEPLASSNHFYRLIYQKRLTKLSVCWETPFRVLQNVRIIAATLRLLNIKGSPKAFDSLTRQEFLALIPELKTIAVLELASILVTSDIFEMLSSKEHLQILSMILTPADAVRNPIDEYRYHFTEEKFPSLRGLTLEDPSDGPHPNFSTLTAITRLQSLKVALSGKVTLESFRRCSSALSAGFPCLHSITITVTKFQDNTEFMDSSETFSVFQPLLSLTELRHFRIEVPSHISLTDEHIEQMARAWPHLLDFHLGCKTPFEGDETELTLSCLVSFAEHCPSLQCLCIGVDATAVPHRPLTDKTVFSESLIILELSGSSVGETIAVASYIADLLHGGDCLVHHAKSSDESWRYRIHKWNEVATLVDNIREARSRGVRRAFNLVAPEGR